ncbi:MAG: hypothetical protein ABDK93_04755, partial [Atribacterota bacterium]
MKKTVLVVLLILLVPSSVLAYDVLLWGKGKETIPPLEDAVALLGDLGGHRLSPNVWEQSLPSPERTVILPAPQDLTGRAENLQNLVSKKYPVVVSDVPGTYLPFFSFTLNYHTTVFFNFTTESPSFP